jgi:hypothetical protein
MLKQLTGEPCAGELHARSGGGGMKSFPTPITKSCLPRIAAVSTLRLTHQHPSDILCGVESNFLLSFEFRLSGARYPTFRIFQAGCFENEIPLIE